MAEQPVKGELIDLTFKHEGHNQGQIIGPAWWRFKQTNPNYKDDYFNKPKKEIWENVENGEKMPNEDRHFSKWITFRHASQLARKFGVPLNEI